MIPKIAYFYWSKESPLTYLRFLTLATFRKLHPDWTMKICHTNTGKFQKWPGIEQQDFLFDKNGQYDYIDKCQELDVEIIGYDRHKDKAPNFISDFYRWEMLSRTGGWYLDVDQIVLKNFSSLCTYDFVIDGSNSYFVGVVGCSPDNPMSKYIYKAVMYAYDPNYYCCIGPWMSRKLFHNNADPNIVNMRQCSNVLLTHGNIFYPIITDNVLKLYNETIDIPDESYCIHWYGGHPESQKFNNAVTEANFYNYKNTITKYVGKILK